MANEQERNKAIILELHEEIWNKGKYQLLSTALSAGFVDHPPKGGVQRGSEALREEAAALRDGFPDFRYQVIQMVAEDDKVVCLGRLTGTHTGAYRELKPSGGVLDRIAISSYRLASGKVAERWAMLNPAALMQSLAFPPVGTTAF